VGVLGLEALQNLHSELDQVGRLGVPEGERHRFGLGRSDRRQGAARARKRPKANTSLLTILIPDPPFPSGRWNSPLTYTPRPRDMSSAGSPSGGSSLLVDSSYVVLSWLEGGSSWGGIGASSPVACWLPRISFTLAGEHKALNSRGLMGGVSEENLGRS